MPEGDALHRAARRLQPLVGQRLEVESPNPRGKLTGVADRVDGRVLESVEAVGKNLLLRFEGGVVVRSHLRMTGRWRVERRGTRRSGWGCPGSCCVATSSRYPLDGPVLSLETGSLTRVGPDILADELDLDEAAARLRAAGERRSARRSRTSGSSPGSGTWGWPRRSAIGVSPWTSVRDASDATLRDAIAVARRLMQDSLASQRSARKVYRRAGRPCSRCGTIVRSRGQGDADRTAYWCPGCQAGGGPPGE